MLSRRIASTISALVLLTPRLVLGGSALASEGSAPPDVKNAALTATSVKVTSGEEAAVTAQLQQDLQKAMLALYMHNVKTRSAGKADPGPGLAGPFNGLESFGREDTAAELTRASIEESNAMVDQIERAVVAETKRSMFRALTRLRGTTISSYDGMANSQGANIDQYSRSNQWRSTHATDHLAVREGDVETWAFPASPPPGSP
eukprot:TRINITY_DN106637_c0_g1_i1.p1 TRINITY_DN106637_c0_g1~~TRINITY_DN106637_c0_g1_i1.p1  ORF type:complete len:203 (+),score=49.03 TRINITY_DN106637_c0_g1_i1:102-710(+)